MNSKNVSVDGIILNAEQRNRLQIYYELLQKWQRAINLVSAGTLNDFWTRHVADSLQLLPHLQGKLLLDMGSGGGFPGMVLAIVSDFNVTCLDSDNRKIQFLSEVARLTGTKLNLVNQRVENFSHDQTIDTVCARGFAELKMLLQYTLQHSAINYGVFLKGKNVEKEIEEAQKFFDFQYDMYPSKVSENSWIVVVSSVAEKN